MRSGCSSASRIRSDGTAVAARHDDGELVLADAGGSARSGRRRRPGASPGPPAPDRPARGPGPRSAGAGDRRRRPPARSRRAASGSRPAARQEGPAVQQAGQDDRAPTPRTWSPAPRRPAARRPSSSQTPRQMTGLGIAHAQADGDLGRPPPAASGSVRPGSGPAAWPRRQKAAPEHSGASGPETQRPGRSGEPHLVIGRASRSTAPYRRRPAPRSPSSRPRPDFWSECSTRNPVLTGRPGISRRVRCRHSRRRTEDDLPNRR